MISEADLKRNRDLLKITVPVNTILQKMRYYGVPISRDVLFYKSQAWKTRLNRLRMELFERIGHPINLYSSQQLLKLLYKECGFEPIIEKGKITADQYALATLHYQYGRCDRCNATGIFLDDVCSKCKGSGRTEWDRILHLIRESKLIFHRYINFLGKFLLEEDCTCGKSRYQCNKCGGTGYVRPVTFDPHFVSERNGQWLIHPSYRQSPNTDRFACDGPNLQQFARYHGVFKIFVRDIVVAPRDFVLVACDLKKADLWGAAVFYKSSSLLKNLEAGDSAFAEFASQAFGIPLNHCQKGSQHYTGGKILKYASLYDAKHETLQKVLIKDAGIYRTFEECRHIKKLIDRENEDYYDAVKEHSWNCYRKGYARSIHGAILRISRDHRLAGYNDWREIYKDRINRELTWRARDALQAFEKICRTVSSFTISNSMTGIATQLSLLKAVDHIDRMMNANWSIQRHYNGNWEIARPVISKHDEQVWMCPVGMADEIAGVVQKKMEDYNDFFPLENHPSIRVPIKASVEIYRNGQWECNPPENWSDMTEEKNPELFWRDGIMFSS